MIKFTHVAQAFIVEILTLANISLLSNGKQFDNVSSIAKLIQIVHLPFSPVFLRIAFKKVFPILLISGQ